MRWAAPRKAGSPKSWVHGVLVFHDLFDDEGQLLGWVRQDTRGPSKCTIAINEHLFEPDFGNTPMTLAMAKKTLVARFVLRKLEE